MQLLWLQRDEGTEINSHNSVIIDGFINSDFSGKEFMD
jgi:hypothetical protein